MRESDSLKNCNNKGRSRKNGRFVSKQVVAAALHAHAEGSTSTASDAADAADAADGGTRLMLHEISVVVPTKPRSSRSAHALDPRSQRKLERAENDLARERARTSGLVRELAAARIDYGVQSENHEIELHDERIKLQAARAELKSVKAKLRNAQNSLISARADSRRKAVAATERMRDRSDTKLEVARERHCIEVAKMKEAQRMQREADRQTALLVIREAKQSAKKAKIESRHAEKQLAAKVDEATRAIQVCEAQNLSIQTLQQALREQQRLHKDAQKDAQKV